MIDVETYGAAVGAAKRYTDEHSGGSSDAVKYTEQTLTTAQQAQARENIGAGTSDFSGDYSDLENKPKVNGVPLDGDMTTSDLGLKVTSTYDNENIILNIN